MRLVELTGRFNELTDELTKTAIMQNYDISDLKDLDIEKIVLFQKLMEFVDVTSQLLMESAKTMENINNKLDMLNEDHEIIDCEIKNISRQLEKMKTENS